MKIAKIMLLLVASVGVVKGASAESDWGSKIQFLGAPAHFSSQNSKPVEAFVMDPVRGQAPSNWQKYLLNATTPHLSNGIHRIFAYRSPSSLNEICRIYVDDVKKPIPSNNKYCVKTDGFCRVEGGGETKQLYLNAADGKTQAGSC